MLLERERGREGVGRENGKKNKERPLEIERARNMLPKINKTGIIKNSRPIVRKLPKQFMLFQSLFSLREREREGERERE